MKSTAPTTVVRRIDAEGNQREAVDAASGEFNAILATEGEASDGHILLMRGLKLPESMPLMLSHSTDSFAAPLTVLGTVGNFRKRNGQLHTRGKILLDDGGEEGLDFRKDITAMVNAGGLPAMSIRWDTEKSERRINLPKDNPHHVDASKTSTEDPRYWGHVITKSTGREGSIVALPADAGAVIQRAAESTSESSTALLTTIGRELERDAGIAQEVLESFERISTAIRESREAGIGDDDIAAFIAEDLEADPDDLCRFDYTDSDGSQQPAYLPRAAWEQLRGESLREHQAATAALQEAKRESVKPKREEAPKPVPDESDQSAELLRVVAEVPRMLERKLDDVLYRKLGRIPK